MGGAWSPLKKMKTCRGITSSRNLKKCKKLITSNYTVPVLQLIYIYVTLERKINSFISMMLAHIPF